MPPLKRRSVLSDLTVVVPHPGGMTVLSRRPVLRWLLPAFLALVLAAAGSAIGVITAAARSGLPHRSAAQLLVDVQGARLDGLSGTIVQNADLGLPQLPDTGGSGSSDPTSLVSGSHTLRLWYAGPNRFRVALLGSLGEYDLVRNGTDLWTWSSKDKSAGHHVVPLERRAPHSLASASPVTPQKAAEAALRAITPTTRVSTDGTAVVAGRSAYELLLQPRGSGSLVGSVRIAIDGKTHVPTRVQVFAKHAGKPAFEVGFTSFDPSRPAASVFRFNPPAGTKVTDGSYRPLTAQSARQMHAQRAGQRPAQPAGQPRAVGTGWATVLVAKTPQGGLGATAGSGGASNSAVPGQLAQVMRALPRVSGRWGSGRLLQGTLFSAVLTDDGRIAVGAVSPQRLYAALSHG
jgi:outer membrane lipoprotein-sorting protein